ncbi:hypothetical protein K438DRAFT_1293471 [Mycena galopus ATCC 62051]|nr:hypothetical protein K438DRAFT_1293471 [Mycena galopus ATCC 62051]
MTFLSKEDHTLNGKYLPGHTPPRCTRTRYLRRLPTHLAGGPHRHLAPGFLSRTAPRTRSLTSPSPSPAPAQGACLQLGLGDGYTCHGALALTPLMVVRRLCRTWNYRSRTGAGASLCIPSPCELGLLRRGEAMGTSMGMRSRMASTGTASAICGWEIKLANFEGARGAGRTWPYRICRKRSGSVCMKRPRAPPASPRCARACYLRRSPMHVAGATVLYHYSYFPSHAIHPSQCTHTTVLLCCCFLSLVSSHICDPHTIVLPFLVSVHFFFAS